MTDAPPIAILLALKHDTHSSAFQINATSYLTTVTLESHCTYDHILDILLEARVTGMEGEAGVDGQAEERAEELAEAAESP